MRFPTVSCLALSPAAKRTTDTPRTARSDPVHSKQHPGSSRHQQRKTNVAKEEAIRVSATVKEALPNAVFRVELDNGHQIIAHAFAKREAFAIEYRIHCTGRKVRWLYSSGRPYFDINGRPARLMGVTMDISERRAASEALKEALEEVQLLRDQLQAENSLLRKQMKQTQSL